MKETGTLPEYLVEPIYLDAVPASIPGGNVGLFAAEVGDIPALVEYVRKERRRRIKAFIAQVGDKNTDASALLAKVFEIALGVPHDDPQWPVSAMLALIEHVAPLKIKLKKTKRGRSGQWSVEKLAQLICDFDALAARHPKASKRQVGEKLHLYKKCWNGHSSHALRQKYAIAKKMMPRDDKLRLLVQLPPLKNANVEKIAILKRQHLSL